MRIFVSRARAAARPPELFTLALRPAGYPLLGEQGTNRTDPAALAGPLSSRAASAWGPAPGGAPDGTDPLWRARRPARRRGGGGAAVPRGRLLGPWRVPRGRGVLRSVGLPDHLAAAGRMEPEDNDQAWCVLGAAGAAAVAGAVLPGRRDRAVLRGRGLRAGDPRSQGRRDLGAHVLEQLASDRRGKQLFRRHRAGVAARAHVVAGDRGAVLRRVADPGARRAVAGPSPREPIEPSSAARSLRCHDRGRDRLGSGHRNPVRRRSQSGSRVLRDRHARVRPADRCRAGDRPGRVER